MEKNDIQFLLENKKLWENKTPCFIINKERLNSTIDELKNCLKGEVAYSHKTNPDLAVIQAVFSKGCSFLVSSLEELEKLVKITNISPDKIFFQSPSLTSEQFEEIRKKGIYRFSIDSIDQLDLILEDIAKNANKGEIFELLVRINTGVKIDHPALPYGMDSYLGFPLDEAEKILKRLNELRQKGIIKLGIHNHLLSQNTYLDVWEKNLKEISNFLTKLKSENIGIDVVDFGGGYPVEYDMPVPSLLEISKIIAKAQEIMSEVFPNVHYMFEPGRKLVAESVVLVTKVVHSKKFQDQDVAILNCSLYNCSLDTLIVDLYLPAKKVELDKPVQLKSYVVRGSTPDSLDVFAKKIDLPELKNGDYIAFLRCGAYSFGSEFISLDKVSCMGF